MKDLAKTEEVLENILVILAKVSEVFKGFWGFGKGFKGLKKEFRGIEKGFNSLGKGSKGLQKSFGKGFGGLSLYK